MNIIYWSTVSYEQGELIIAATNKGLCFVGSVNAGIEELNSWHKKKRPKYTLEENKEKLKSMEAWFTDYFQMKNPSINFELDIDGTAFQQQVWQALRKIPYGETSTYLNIAKAIHNEKAIRAVGRAIGANPLAIVIPCHRVIGKNGDLTGFRGGLEMKKYLLHLENPQLY